MNESVKEGKTGKARKVNYENNREKKPKPFKKNLEAERRVKKLPAWLRKQEED
jgi:hypothetical protein